MCDPGPSRSKAKVVKVLYYRVHQTLNFISTHNDKIETHIAKYCTTGAWRAHVKELGTRGQAGLTSERSANEGQEPGG